MTQQQLGDAVGMTKASISGLELGTSKKPSAPNLIPIARALGVNPDWLITGRGNKHAETNDEIERLRLEVEELRRTHPMIWPSEMRDVDLMLVEDIARRTSKASGTPIEKIRAIITDAIIDHFSDDKLRKAANAELQRRIDAMPDGSKLSIAERDDLLDEIVEEMRAMRKKVDGGEKQKAG